MTRSARIGRRRIEKKARDLRAQALPTDPSIKGRGWTLSRPILDADAPEGTYRVDCLARELANKGILKREGGRQNGPVRRARITVDTAGVEAILHAKSLLIEVPAQRKAAGETLLQLSDLNRRITRFLKRGIYDIAPAIARWEKYEKPKYALWDAHTAVSEIRNQLGSFKDSLHDFLRVYEISRGQGKNADPLVRYYIFAMAIFWTILTGMRPKRSASGPFIRLLAEGWRDLEFPVRDHRGKSREPLEDWFGSLVVKQLFQKWKS